jgi:gamma-glutamyltranspeptidase/glutathione hydrolase
MRRRAFLAALPVSALAGAATGAPTLYPGVEHGDRIVGANFAGRSTVWGANGAAATAHPMATMIAIDILKRGGSAVDAAIAANAALGFLEPTRQRRRRRLLRHAVGPQAEQGRGPERVGPQPQGPVAGDGAGAVQGR